MADDVPQPHKLCLRGDKSALSKLIKKDRAILRATDEEYGQSLLHVCAEHGREELVHYLLQEKFTGKFDINAVDKNGWTPLHSACKSGHVAIIEALLNKGAFSRALTNEGASPLHYFVRNDCNDIQLFHSTITLLVKKSGNVDVENKHGETPLHHAAMRGRSQCVLSLLKNKANPNAVTIHGETALHFSARGCHFETFNILLMGCADPSKVYKDSDSVYSIARQYHTMDMCKLIYRWYITNGVELTDEIKEDEEELLRLDNSDDDEKRRRKKRTSKPDSSAISSNPKSKSRQSSNSSRTRVTQQESPKPKKGSSAAIQVAAPPSKDESFVVSPKSIRKSTTTPEPSFTTLEQRIEKLKTRVALADQEMNKEKEIEIPGQKVGNMIENFERLKGSDDIDSRIERLKMNVASAIGDIDTKKEAEAPSPFAQQLALVQPISFSLLRHDLAHELQTEGFACRACNRLHNEVPLYLFCSHPSDYDELSATDKQNRSRISADLCSIDNLRFFVRGLLEIPVVVPAIPGSENERPEHTTKERLSFTWGVWVSVETADFFRIMEKWSSNDVMQIQGFLNNNVPLYNDSMGASVTLKTRVGGLRPSITVNGDTQLSKDQRCGISITHFSEVLDFVLHRTEA